MIPRNSISHLINICTAAQNTSHLAVLSLHCIRTHTQMYWNLNFHTHVFEILVNKFLFSGHTGIFWNYRSSTLFSNFRLVSRVCIASGVRERARHTASIRVQYYFDVRGTHTYCKQTTRNRETKQKKRKIAALKNWKCQLNC